MSSSGDECAQASKRAANADKPAAFSIYCGCGNSGVDTVFGGAPTPAGLASVGTDVSASAGVSSRGAAARGGAEPVNRSMAERTWSGTP
jgi:hypothetical protein